MLELQNMKNYNIIEAFKLIIFLSILAGKTDVILLHTQPV